jgi:hypothetical protein
MQDRSPMSLDRARVMLRRWWLVPVVLGLLGVLLGSTGALRDDVVVANAKIVVRGDESVRFLSIADPQEVGLSASALAALAVSPQTAESVGGAGRGSHITASADVPNKTLNLSVTASTSRKALDAANAYVDYLRAARVADAKATSAQVLANVTATRSVLNAYLAGQETPATLPDGSAVVIVSKSDAAEQLVDLGQLEGVAQSLATFDGGLVSTVKVESKTSSWALAALLAVAFLGLGVAVVLVVAPLDTRLRTRRDIEHVAGPNSLIAVTSSGQDLWPLAAAIGRMQQNEVLLIPTGSKDADDIANGVQQLLDENGVDKRIRSITASGPDLSAAARAENGIVVIVREGIDRQDDLASVCHTLATLGRTDAAVALTGLRDADRRYVHA